VARRSVSQPVKYKNRDFKLARGLLRSHLPPFTGAGTGTGTGTGTAGSGLGFGLGLPLGPDVGPVNFPLGDML
jgi:hypothetical protein